MNFMPHIHCYLGSVPLVWTMFVTDLLIGLAYVSISLTLLRMAKNIKIPFTIVIFCFGIFIAACGATHFMEVWTMWNPDYWLSAGVKLVTMVASVGTALYLLKLRHPIYQIADSYRLSEQRKQENERLVGELESIVAVRTQELDEAENRFRSIFDQAAIGMSVLNLDGSWRSINQKFCDIIGYTQDEMLKKTFQEITHPDDLGPDLKLVDDILIGKISTYSLEKRYFCKNGNIVWVNLTVSLLKDEHGKPKYFISCIEDISQRKQAERNLVESEARKAAVLEAAIDAILIMDAEGIVTEFNPAAESLFGYSRDEAMGKPLATLIIPPRLQALHTEGIKRYLDTREPHVLNKRVEMPAMRRDGTEFPAEIAVVRIRWEGPPLFTGYIRDITERKKAAESEMLRRENEVVAAANKELEAFSYSVSHDLRGPLRAIDGFSKILLEESTELSEGSHLCLSRIRHNTQRMGQLIDDLLAFSRLSRQEIVVKKIDLTALLKQVLDDFRPEIEARHIGLHHDPMPPCKGDASLLKQVWVNLISNAIKYSRPKKDAFVEIGSKVLESRNETVYFVKDNGVGFDMNYADKLFGVFQRLHKMEEFEGTGVGLAIVKRIIERHGGRVWAEGAVGEGATFYFTLQKEGHI